MATTRIFPLHTGKGRSVAKALRDVTDYMENPLKTEDGERISSYACAAETADAEFLFSKAQYYCNTGRDQKRRDVIAYHVRQSFKPGEVTPEDANRIGYELAMRFTKGRHAFIVCTHTDRAHVHNHVVWNSTTLDCSGKWRDFFRSGRALRRLSDTLCVEHGLSVIENPAPGHGKHYGAWLGDGRPLSHKDMLRAAIDAALGQAPPAFEDFLLLMRKAGYTVNDERKYITFLLPGWGQPVRMDTLKGEHTETAVRQRMAQATLSCPDGAIHLVGSRRVRSSGGKVFGVPEPQRKPGLLIDIEAKLRQGKGDGCARWAKVFNLKQAAQTLLCLQEHGVDSDDALEEKASAATTRFNDLSARIKTLEAGLKANAALQKHIINYSKTRKTYEAYRKAGYSKKFRSEHESDILLHQSAKKTFDALGYGKDKKIPAIATLRAECAVALDEKRKPTPGTTRPRPRCVSCSSPVRT